MASRIITVSVAPAPSSGVEYYETTTRTVIITNLSNHKLLIEEIALRFQSDFGQATVVISCHCGSEASANGVVAQEIAITPTPLFLAWTNRFDVKVRYRIVGDTISDPNDEVFQQSAYVIIHEPRTGLGQLFISLKQPEDVELGRTMARMARRAGLVPFLKADNERLTDDIWTQTIEPALRMSDAMVVIWTSKTDWSAAGVQREIDLFRTLGRPEGLLLATDTVVPQPYRGTNIEYARFNPESPGEYFADAVNTLRTRLKARR